VWNDSWKASYISAWGIIERFRWANVASAEDIISMMGAVSTRSNTLRRRFSELSERRVQEVLDYSILGSIETFLGEFLPFIDYSSSSAYFDEKLRWCPICVQQGFHSLFHQLVFLDKCPYHDSPLVQKCKACNSTIPYSINRTRTAFSCLRGHKLYDDTVDRYGQRWSESSELRVVLSMLRDWTELMDQHRHRVSRLHVVPEACIQQREMTYAHLNQVLSDDSYERAIWRSLPVLPSINQQQINTSSQQSGITYVKFEYRTLNAYFKSIARHIRKRILKDHRHCVHHYVVGMDMANRTCVLALAYILWRAEFEGLTNLSSVDNGRRTQDSNLGGGSHNLGQRLVDTRLPSVYRNIVGKVSGLSSVVDSWPELLWLKSRYVCEVAYKRFYDWIAYCSTNVDVSLQFSCLPAVDIQYPFVVLVDNDEDYEHSQRKFVFYVWRHM
jgi:hypothetical protein